MQNLSFLLIVLLASLLAACSSGPEGQKVAANEAEEVATVATSDTLTIDTESSVIQWVATEPGDEGHNGILRVKSGELYTDGNTLVGGQVVLDMLSIEVLDLEGDRKMKLEGHLKDTDFFEATTYPEGTFTLTEVAAAEGDSTATHYLTGNLALKDSVKSITIPAMVQMSEGGLKAQTPPFTIDRTQWGVVYRSGAIGTVADKLINDQIGLEISLRASK